MQGFETKKALLEHLGKNPDDRKLVDRLILRGDVHIEDGMYYIVDKDAIIDWLREVVKKLRGEITTMRESNWDLWEAKAQWEHYQNLYEEEKADKQERIRKCFRRIQTIKPRADWEEFRDWVMSDED